MVKAVKNINQKGVSEALIETNSIVLYMQQNGYEYDVIENNDYFDQIELIETYNNTYVKYTLITTKHYSCDINFFEFSNKDIVSKVSFCLKY